MPILFYGAGWCGDCIRAKKYLDDNAVPYEYIDIEKDATAVDEVLKRTKGLRSIPVIVFPDGTLLIEPSTSELASACSALNQHNVVKKTQ